MEKVWLKHYPAGVPAEVKTDVYPSLIALLEESFRKYRDLPAYIFMGKRFSFGQVDDLSRAFAAFLQSQGLARGDRVAIMEAMKRDTLADRLSGAVVVIEGSRADAAAPEATTPP